MTDSLFTPEDDNFHPPTPGEPWFTETCWFSFNVPERKMGGWFYGWVRRNLGLAGGGFFVWDPSGALPHTIPYYKYQYSQPLAEPVDLRDFQFPEGFSVRMIEPLSRYRLRFSDRNLVDIDCEFSALFPPHGFKSGEPPFHAQPHLDQMGHVKGAMTLLGETIPIDCYSIRDRSWGPRPDNRGGRIGYPFACAKDIAFCLFAVPNRDFSDTNERVNHGFLWQDGEKVQLASGVRHVRRDPETNWPVEMEIDAVDEKGRKLKAHGVVESGFEHPGPRGVGLYTSIRWEVNGKQAYGEDQDIWRYDQWRAAMDRHRKGAR